jgi:two-component system, OmpR family, phosphate regulon sensor histidine kinase PhoR
MKDKNSILIFGCVLTVLALLAIQCYFMYNTYQLKEREIKFEVKTILEKLDNRDDPKESNQKDDKEQALLIQFVTQKISDNQFVYSLQNIENAHSKVAIQFIKNKLKSTNYEVGFSKNIGSIVYISENNKNTIIHKNIELYRSETALKKKFLLSSGRWRTSSESGDNKSKINKTYEFVLIKDTYYSINNLNYLVFSEMIGLLIVSFLLMVFVISLFYYSIKNLIKQKKIAATQRDFINNITHEFKTPLATLSIATKTLNNHFLEKETLENTVAIIERQNNRLQKIFNQVNFKSILTNVENTKIEQNIDKEFIENSINDFKIANPEIEILSKIDSDIDLKMSKFHFNTVFFNLLENAVKYGGTKLEINAVSEKDSIGLKIKDNGIGISRSEQVSIFDKFYRVSNGDVHNVKGLGLGLFYAKEILVLYNGKVSVESSKEGSEFLILIPKS